MKKHSEIIVWNFRSWNKINTIMVWLVYALCPFAIIWSCNTLWNTGIHINFRTWLAGFLLIIVLKFCTMPEWQNSPLRTFYREMSRDEEDEDIETEEERPERKAKLPEELIAYKKEQARRKKAPFNG